MRVDINPFYTRASDNIDSDEKFVKLFSPEILSIFRDHPIWHAVNILRSSPGGGKTTLFKILTPNILALIKSSKSHDDHCKELFSVLKELEVYDSKGNVNIAAAFTAFNKQYTTIEHLAIPDTGKLRLFASLLNTRIILSILKAICQVKGITYPEQLVRITFPDQHSLDIPAQLRGLSSCHDLYEWATTEEEMISDRIDSIHYNATEDLKGKDTLFALDLLAPSRLLLDNKKLDVKIVMMLDDVHNLSATQRSFLVQTIIEKRPLVNTWISERLKALTMEELLSEGSIAGRDINIIELENFWSKRPKQFEHFTRSVANRRVEMFFESKKDFASFLSEKMSVKYQGIIRDALHNIQARVKNKYGNNNKYSASIEAKEQLEEEDYVKLVEWRALEILIYRTENKKAPTLAFDEDSNANLLEAQEGNDVRIAAQLFLHEEFNIPFYYGISTVCRLASSNIEQFLNIAGELFDIVQTNSIKKLISSDYDLSLPPERQEDIIKKIVNQRWKDLSTNVPMFDDIKRIMDAIGQFCYNETYVPNAWNSPGINGIAITMAQRNEIKDIILKDRNHQYYKLARCLTICIAYNLIDFKLNYRCKGKDWMVLYLNRIYCAKYKLPLHNGKFREKTLKDLLNWFKSGVNPQSKINL